MFKTRSCSVFIRSIAMSIAFYLLFSLSWPLGNACFAEDEEIPIKGVLLAATDGKKIKSPWGDLKNQMLLLNKHQRISLKNNNLEIIFGLTYWDNKSASYVDNSLKISSLYVAKSPISVKLFQEKGSGKWCATDGILGISRNKAVVFEGIKIIVIGGSNNPVKIAGVALSDVTIVIKNGKPLKME